MDGRLPKKDGAKGVARRVRRMTEFNGRAFRRLELERALAESEIYDRLSEGVMRGDAECVIEFLRRYGKARGW